MYDIRKLFLFRGLPDDVPDSLLSAPGACVDFARGELIYDGEHFRRALGVLLSGSAYAGDRGAGKASFTAGDVFGAAALFGAGEVYVSRVTARTACRVLFIPEEALTALFERCPACALNYIRFLSDRVRYLNGKIAQYTGDGAAARLWRLLRERADADGRVANVNMALFARLVGLGRTSVYRALDELIESGAIERVDRDIILRR